MKNVVYGLMAVVLLGVGTAARAAADESRPNVVWLVAEDMSAWLPCYGDPTVATPNIDRLAHEGVRYDNAFASSPVCAPARSSLITGMYATRIGSMHMRNVRPSNAALRQDPTAYDDIPPYEAVPPAFVRCFPEHLRVAGYRCTNNSKKDYQFYQPVGVWDQTSSSAHWRDGSDDQPFFAVFNFGGTHESKAFPNATPQPEVVAPEAVTIPPFYPDTPAVRDAVARTYNNIATLDQWVGERVQELEDAGKLHNTVVMFFSDHGVGLPRGKRSCYDTGSRVPLVVRFPDGRGAGTADDRVVSFVDFGPSILSLAGVDPDPRLDGTPFLGAFARERDGYQRGHAYTHADRFDAAYDGVRSVSDGRYRYLRNYVTDQPYIIANAFREQLPMTHDLYALRTSGDATAEQWQMAATRRPIEEFYDTQNDPWEVRNLASDPAHAVRIAAMRERVEAWMVDTGDLGFVLPETKLVREHLWTPDGEQPLTAAAVVQHAAVELAGGEVVCRFTVESATPGASLAYRLGTGPEAMGPWQVYSGGHIDAAKTLGRLEVNAHRIGFKPSAVVIDLGHAD